MVSGSFFDWTDGDLVPAEVFLDGQRMEDVLRAVAGEDGEVHVLIDKDTNPPHKGRWTRYDVLRGDVTIIFGYYPINKST